LLLIVIYGIQKSDKLWNSNSLIAGKKYFASK